MRAGLTSSIALLLAVGCGSSDVETAPDDDIPLPMRSAERAADAGNAPKPSVAPPTPTNATIQVTLAGSGTAAITSTPAGVTCTAAACKGTFPIGTSVMLTAAPTPGSVFAGWSVGCTGIATCAVKLDHDVAVGADLESFAGAWSGNYTNTRVANGCTFNNGGKLDVAVTNAGAMFSSSETMDGLQIRDLAGCGVVGAVNGSAPSVAVTVAGNVVTGTWNINLNGGGTLPFPFTGRVTGKTLSGTWTCATCTGSFTLTKP